MILTFSETSTKVALLSVKIVSEVFSSLSEDCDSTFLERLFILLPTVKTMLSSKIFELQRTWANQNWSCFTERRTVICNTAKLFAQFGVAVLYGCFFGQSMWGKLILGVS